MRRNCGLDAAELVGHGNIQMIPCDMRNTTVGLDVSVKDARLHLAVLFDSPEQPAVDKLDKTREEK